VTTNEPGAVGRPFARDRSVGTAARARRRSLRSPVLVQMTRFALVGGAGFLVDTVSFTLLRLTPIFAASPLKAGVVSTLLAIGVNWIGNRSWTFDSRRAGRTVEAAQFLAVSLLGMVVALGCLAVSHYVLDLRTVLADNIAKNVVGLVLGSALRFVLYRHWVYRPAPSA
jgi:putative flippase GtrA